MKAASRGGSRTDPAVAAFLRELEHPLKPELLALAKLILGASPEIQAGIKWNSPSFKTADWFATINVLGGGRPPRPADPPALRLILHRGAKRKDAKKPEIADPAGLLQWLGEDRALVALDADSFAKAKTRTALRAIVREWVRLL
ncbi:MAG TPA: DUF1801 domain-containing protein [Planctomycetota bacterium]